VKSVTAIEKTVKENKGHFSKSNQDQKTKAKNPRPVSPLHNLSRQPKTQSGYDTKITYVIYVFVYVGINYHYPERK